MSRVYGLIPLLVLTLAALPAVGAPRTAAPVAPRETTPTVLDPEFMGISIRDPWYEFGTDPNSPNAPNEVFQEQMGATLERAGVRWVRLEFHIPYDQNNPNACDAACQGEIAKSEYFVKTVAPNHNLKVLALLGFDLLRGTDAHGLNSPTTVPSHYGGGVNQYMDTWLTRALSIADTYSDTIAAYEVLNEENRLPPSGDAIKPPIMGRLVTKFYRFCKGIDVPPDEPIHGCANAKIILGGIHPRGSSDPAHPSDILMTDAQYLTAIYTDPASFAGFKATHPEIGYPLDGVAYHPYPQEIALSPNDVLVNRGLLRMRQALEDASPTGANDPCRQFWITEVGYNVGFDPDGPKNPLPPQTEQGQVAFMQDVYTTLAQRQLSQSPCGGGPEVANVFWFKYEDFPPDTGANAQHWGIVHIPMPGGNCEGGCYDPTGIPTYYRSSFWAYRELAGQPVYRANMPVVNH
jgi:hypothetical protein